MLVNCNHVANLDLVLDGSAYEKSEGVCCHLRIVLTPKHDHFSRLVEACHHLCLWHGDAKISLGQCWFEIVGKRFD